ncbi:hypothetical protein B0H16DRAFT_1318505 [Mycena metata]|uniref:Cyclin N-terminal domain-containing protein n=1 Tax=Mycena metata TaxID=1033252 RepID=A0AAD7IXC6_9AGAR|nr:hypothetical protein B0H16DRAFT_1318505 [Mycena metata]
MYRAYDPSLYSLSKVGACFMMVLFGRSLSPSQFARSTLRLCGFVTFILRSTNLEEVVLFLALHLLLRLRWRYPSHTVDSCQRAFLAAYMLSSKVLLDHCYSTKAWRRVTGDMYSLQDINDMERALCSLLEWDINVRATTMTSFREALLREFGTLCVKNRGFHT